MYHWLDGETVMSSRISEPGRKNPECVLSQHWGISRDPLNWILLHKSGNRWRNPTYYSTPQLLLQSLHNKVLLTGPVDPDLIQHIESCLQVAEACSEAFAKHIHTQMGASEKMSPQTAHTTLDQVNGQQ